MSSKSRRLTPGPISNSKIRSRSVSPSKVGKTDISIIIDPASRHDSGNESDPFIYKSRFIVRSYEYDRELLRRQHAMIAVQPMSPSEQIEEKRRLLRIRADARRQADAAIKAADYLAVRSQSQQRGRSRTRSLSKSVENLSTIVQSPVVSLSKCTKKSPFGSIASGSTSGGVGKAKAKK